MKHLIHYHLSNICTLHDRNTLLSDILAIGYLIILIVFFTIIVSVTVGLLIISINYIVDHQETMRLLYKRE